MNKCIITIARSFGSGGKTIGLELGQMLGIPCYENEILDMASEDSGISKELFYQNKEMVRNGIFTRMIKKIPAQTLASPRDEDFLSNDNLFQYQTKIIRYLALEGSCIIIGKCADQVLGDLKNVYRFFIDAPHESCVNSIAAKLCISEAEADRLTKKTDKYRSDYYKYYTGKEWKDPANYDLILNSSRIGKKNCAELIKNYIEFRSGETFDLPEKE